MIKQSLALLLLSCSLSYGAFRDCDTAQVDDVINAVNGTQVAGHTKFTGQPNDGDIIRIPATGANPGLWNKQIVITKAISLQGAGPNLTIIYDQVVGVSLCKWFASGTNANSVMTGFQFLGGNNGQGITGLSTNHGNIAGGDCFNVQGSTENGWTFRAYNNIFDGMIAFPFFTEQITACIDHNKFVHSAGVGYTYADNFGGPDKFGGDGSWASPTLPQNVTNKAVFEDNLIQLDSGTGWDGTHGGRVWARHNTITSNSPTAAIMTCHGLEGNVRSIRFTAFSNNYVVNAPNSALVKNRGGTVLVFNNYVLGGNGNNGAYSIDTQSDRQSDPTIGFGRATGSCNWDDNVITAGGTNSNPTPFFDTNTIGGGAGASTTTNVVYAPGNANIWTAGQWVGYSVTDLSRPITPNPAVSATEPQYLGGPIQSNTTNSVKCVGSQFGTPLAFQPGDHIVFNRVSNSLDSLGYAGVSSADLIVRGANGAIRPTAWGSFGNGETLEGAWEWNNISGSSLTDNIDFSSFSACPFIAQAPVPAWHNNAQPTSVFPGYVWNAGTTSRIGADGTGLTAGAAFRTTTGSGDAGNYPHYLTQGNFAPSFTAPNPATVHVTAGQSSQTDITANGNPLPDMTAPGGISTISGGPNGGTVTFTGGTGTGSASLNTTSSTPVGHYRLTAIAHNSVSPDDSLVIDLIVDSPGVAPACSLTVAQAGTGQAKVSVTACDTDGTIDHVIVSRGGTPVSGNITVGNPYEFTDTGLANGTYTYTATAYDNSALSGASTNNGCGSGGTASANIIISGVGATPTPPAVILSKPTSP